MWINKNIGQSKLKEMNQTGQINEQYSREENYLIFLSRRFFYVMLAINLIAGSSWSTYKISIFLV